jgi:hypothetical protein
MRVCDGKEITHCAASRNSKGYIELLKDIEANNSTEDIFIIRPISNVHAMGGKIGIYCWSTSLRGARATKEPLFSTGIGVINAYLAPLFGVPLLLASSGHPSYQ